MITELPLPVLNTLYYYLRIPEIEALTEAYPELEPLRETESRKILKHELRIRRLFKWNRCAPDDRDEVMTPRHSPSLVYWPKNRSVYCFGGEVIDRQSPEDVWPASLNDMWRFDLNRMRWSRVNVTSTPYPCARFGSSFLVWRDELVLYGGLGSENYRNVTVRMMACNEVFLFNPMTERWRVMATEMEGPDLCSHTACIKDDLMFVYGGHSSVYAPIRDAQAAQKLFILDLIEQKWTQVDLLPNIQGNGFPMMDLQKVKMVWIGSGRLLLTGEMIEDYGQSFIITFDPETLTNWNFKILKTEGKWWKPRMIGAHGMQIRDILCAAPNDAFYQIAVIRNETDNRLRLVSLGRTEHDKRVLKSKCYVTEMYDKVQKRGVELMKQLQIVIEAEFEKRKIFPNRDWLPTDLTGTYQGTSYCIKNLFLEQSVYRRIMKNEQARNSSLLGRCRVFLKSENVKRYEGQIFDDVDFWEIRKKIKVLVTQLQTKYYLINLDRPICTGLPMRNRNLDRLTIFTAEIDLNQEIEEIVWKPQPLQYRASPTTLEYRLVATENEVLMYGGHFDCNERMRQEGHTYLLTPVEFVQPANEERPLFRGWAANPNLPSTSDT